MFNEIKTIFPGELNKGLGSKFHVVNWVRHETLPKTEGCIRRNVVNIAMKDDNSPNIVNDKNCQASSNRFR